MSCPTTSATLGLLLCLPRLQMTGMDVACAPSLHRHRHSKSIEKIVASNHYALRGIACCWRAGTARAFFRGNGTNVIKIAPETAIKLTCNDRLKRVFCSDLENITPLQRMASGALAGAIAQVPAHSLLACRMPHILCDDGWHS